jgi:glycerol-3-phosphate cytidylyltransferase
MVIGYTTGVFDMFHVGHLNLLRNAAAMCDKLIVGVSTDKLVKEKRKKCKIPFEQRIEIVRGCRYVDLAIPQTTIDKVEEYGKLHFNIVFVGDDWFGHWGDFEGKGYKVVYFPYTEGVSSTNLRK